MPEFQSKIQTGNVLRAQTEGTGRVVRDDSAKIIAGAINQTIKAGAQIAEAATVAPFEQEIEQDLSDFSEARLLNTQDDLLVQLTDAAGDVETAKSAGNESSVNRATDEFKRLTRLRRLGSLSADQAALMAEAKLRRFVNENPFHKAQLVEARDSILGLHRSELAAIDALDTRVQQQDAFTHKLYAKIAADEGINILGKTTEELAAIVAPIQFNKAAWERTKITKELNEEQALNLFYGNESNALQGAYSSFTQILQEEMAAFKDTPDVSLEQFFATLQATEQDFTNSLNFKFGRFIDRSHIDLASQAFTSARKTIEDAVRNDQTATFVSNRLSIQKQNLLSEALFNPAMQAAFVVSDLAPKFIENNVLFRDNASIARRMTKYLTDLGSGNAVTNSSDISTSGRRIAKESGRLLQNAISDKTPQTDAEWEDVFKSVNSMADIVSERDFSSEEMENVLNIGSMQEIAGFVRNEPSFRVTSEKLRRGTERLLTETLLPSIGATLNEQIEVRTLPAGLSRGDNANLFRDVLTTNVSEGGVITFQAKDIGMSPTERNMVDRRVDTLNRGVAVQINKAIRTVAHVNGSTDYLKAAQSTLNRFNLGVFPELTGAISTEPPALNEVGL